GGGSVTGGTVFIPMGYYRCKFDSGTSGLTTITVKSNNVFIRGEGTATVLTVRHPTTNVNYFFTFTPTTQGYGGGVRDLYIQGNSQLNWGILVGTWKFPTFENISVYDVFGGAIDAYTTDPSNGGYMAEDLLIKHIDTLQSTGGCMAQFGIR